MKHNIIVSGIQPSGKLHIGNYVGAVQNWLLLQKQKTPCFFFIADYHSITGNYDPKEKRHDVMNLAIDLLALGIDPKKCAFFVQSHVPEHTELAWIFNTVTPLAFLERMTQFKDKSENQSANINMGLFDYPVLQAADILIYKGSKVPVGRDQIQHIELTRDIARFFNNKFGAVFPEIEPLLTDTPKLRSITEPMKKMSKSLGEKSYIAITDSEEEMYEKIKHIPTEPTGMLPKNLDDMQDNPQFAGVWNMLQMLSLFGKRNEVKNIIAQQPVRYGDLKKVVAKRVFEHFAEFRAKRSALQKNKQKVCGILEVGAKKASKVAKTTMTIVRKKIGVR